jgi:hypothetical protein
MHCQRCQRKIKVRVAIPGNYLCSRECLTEWRRNEATLRDINRARSERRSGSSKSKEMAVSLGEGSSWGNAIWECLEG